MASMVETFPPEIISAIIDALASHDRLCKYQSLKACSLTCRAFVPHCRGHIFRHIYFQDACNTNVSSSTRFIGLITDSPLIAGYILELTYGVSIDDEPHSPLLASTLDQLTSLRSLTLKFDSHERRWSKLHPSTRSSLIRLMNLPTINTLTLMFMDDFDLSDLVSCKTLTRLDLGHVGLTNSGKLDPSYPSFAPIRLQVLSIDYPYDHVRPTPVLEARRPDGKPILDFSYLRMVLFVFSSTADLAWAQEIFTRMRHLETVTLLGKSPSLVESAARLVSKSDSLLETLTRFIVIAHIEAPPSDPLCGLCEVFEEMAGRNRIQKLTIELAMYTDNCPLEDEWGDLERVLLAPGWPSLRQVHLDIICHSGNRLMEELEHIPVVQFPLLSNNKSFEFDFQVFGSQNM